MNINKKLGIWMDHASADLILFSKKAIKLDTILSNFTHQDKTETLSKGEKKMHHKEQQAQADYYERISDEIKKYDEVLLFGPTDAKTELFNILKEDRSFGSIKIEIQQTDQITDNQKLAVVNAYFLK
jgi:stalled ribosome rescue protein Dom34